MARDLDLQIRQRNPGEQVWLVIVDGLVRKAGSEAECHRYAQILLNSQRQKREADDQALAQVIGRGVVR